MTTTTIDFNELVREQRFDHMVREDRAKAVRVVYSHCGNWADAEEAVQEALARMWADRERIDQVRNLAAWLIAEAKYKALEVSRSRTRSIPALLGEDIERVEAQTAEPSSLPCTADPEVMDRIRTALAAMTPSQRKVVELHCLQGLKLAEVAERLSSNRHAVKQLLYTALNHADLSGPAWRDVHAERGIESPEAKAFRSSKRLLKMLPPRQRQAIQLRYIKGLPVADVAARMSIKPHDVHLHINKARRLVRELSADLVPA